jgi:acylphosphatase
MTERFLFSGHVQGVGFRYTAQAIARELGVRGWVKNLPDGRVELLADGKTGQLDDLAQRLEERMGHCLNSVVRAPASLPDNWEGFQIVRGDA